MALDAYDNCIAYMDEQIGVLLGELQRRGVLDDTLVVIVSDHGEGFGEHELFDHGESLYNTELDVPLLIVPPLKNRTERVVRQFVSLRDLPATIVDLVGQRADSPFPGHSLADLWRESDLATGGGTPSEAFSELVGASPRNCNMGRSPANRGPMISLAEGDFVYIRNEGDGAEELFNERVDPRQLSNRVGLESMRPELDRFRKRTARFKLQGSVGPK